jgi:hypothetical protein
MAQPQRGLSTKSSFVQFCFISFRFFRYISFCTLQVPDIDRGDFAVGRFDLNLKSFWQSDRSHPNSWNCLHWWSELSSKIVRVAFCRQSSLWLCHIHFNTVFKGITELSIRKYRVPVKCKTKCNEKTETKSNKTKLNETKPIEM